MKNLIRRLAVVGMAAACLLQVTASAGLAAGPEIHSPSDPQPVWTAPESGAETQGFGASGCRGSFTSPLIEQNGTQNYIFWGAYMQCTSNEPMSIQSELRLCREVGRNIACDTPVATGPYKFVNARFIRSDAERNCSKTGSRLFVLRAFNNEVRGVDLGSNYSNMTTIACVVGQ